MAVETIFAMCCVIVVLSPAIAGYRHVVLALRLFPLSFPCNAERNLIPGWLNPAIGTLTALAAIGAVGTVVTVGPDAAALSSPDDQPIVGSAAGAAGHCGGDGGGGGADRGQEAAEDG